MDFDDLFSLSAHKRLEEAIRGCQIVEEATRELVERVINLERKIIHLEEKTLHQIHELNSRLSRIYRSRSSAVRFTGDVPMQTNALVLNVGQTSTASPITFLADGVTPSGATYSEATYTFNDPSASVVTNPDGITALVTGLEASSGPVSGTVVFSATDTDGAVSQWTQMFTIQTNAVAPPPPPEQLSQSAALLFSDPA